MNITNFNFLPRWYLENINKTSRKKLRIIIVIFLIIDLCLLYFIFLSRNRLNVLNENIKEKTFSYKANNNSYNGRNSKFKSVETYCDFFRDIPKYGEFRNINIDGENIDLEFIGENSSFLNFVKEVEYKNKFNIVGISYLKDEYQLNSDENSKDNLENNYIKNNVNNNKKVWKIELKHI